MLTSVEHRLLSTSVEFCGAVCTIAARRHRELLTCRRITQFIGPTDYARRSHQNFSMTPPPMKPRFVGAHMRVKDILDRKGTAVATIDPDATIAEAVEMLHVRRIGAVVVSADGVTVGGILSERDVVGALATLGSALLTAPIRQFMTTDVVTCTPDDELRRLAITMTEKRFRHLPVTIDGRLAGIVSIGDVVKLRVDELQTEHDQLIDYISSSG
jgi:CBS domain-containing protein